MFEPFYTSSPGPCVPSALLLMALLLILVRCAWVLWHSWRLATPDNASLAEDLRLARRAFDVEALLGGALTAEDADRYYEETTDRDYRALGVFEGPSLHTRLCAPYPTLSHGGFTRQVVLVLAEAPTAGRVLEVGCGRGHCTLCLAGMRAGSTFHGLDRVQRHVQASREACVRGGGYGANVEFFFGDGSEFLRLTSGDAPYDLIFGVEALCHLDTAERLKAFAVACAARLARCGGRLVIVDGFRASSSCDGGDAQTALCLAERAFCIRRMPSKAEWIEAAERVGLTLARDVDLTAEALPFWTRGWRVARALLRLLPWECLSLLRYVLPKHSAANLLAVLMVGHALRCGAVEYGMLVFVRNVI